MNILLLNFHSPYNAGDLAILEETLNVLHESFENARITVTINDPNHDHLPSGATYVGSLMRWVVEIDAQGEWHWRKFLTLAYAVWLILVACIFRLTGWRLLPWSVERRKLMRAYYEANVIAVIGGGHLYARRPYNISFAWLWLGLAIGVVMRKPLLMLPQSYGPLPGTLQQQMLRWLLDRSAFVAAREYTSLTLLRQIGVRTPVAVIPDLAFIAREGSDEQLIETVPALKMQRDRPLIGLTLMDWQGQNPDFENQQGYEAAVVALIKHLYENFRANVILFSQCTGPTAAQDDRRIARKIAAAAAPYVPITVVEQELTPALLQGAYRQLDVLVATRMHSAIFALSHGVPTIAIGYLHKSAGIMEMLGLSHYALDIQAVNGEALCAAFDGLWEVRDSIRQRLNARIPSVQSTVRHLPVLIRHSLKILHA